MRTAWCDAFSCYILTIRINHWWTNIDAHCCQRVTPIFFILQSSFITDLNTCLTYLTTKVSIWTSICTCMKERVCIHWLIFRTLSNTKFCLIVSKGFCWTYFNTLICWVVSPIKLRTFFNTPSCCFITVSNLSCHIWTPTHTLPGWWIGKITRLLAIIHTNIILIVVIRRRWALENTFVCWVVSTWKRYWVTFVHTSLIAIISEWVYTVIHTAMCCVVSIKWR